MRGHCSNCYNWIVPAQRVGRYGKPGIGHCRLDAQLAHPAYSCIRYRPTLRGLLDHFGITAAELTWLQAHPHRAAVMRLRQAWRAVWHKPQDIDCHAEMNLMLAAVRTEIRARVLETEMSAGNPAGIDNEHTANVRPKIHDHDPRS